MTIEPHKIYKIKLRDGQEFTGQAISFKMHSVIFKTEEGKRIEIESEKILSHKVIKDLTAIPHKSQDRDHKLKFRKSGQLVPAYKEIK